MLSIHKINPMFRAVGTVGAVAALVGGITFANLTSNTVALSPNNLTSATAALAIAGSCPATTTTPIPGLTDASLAPGHSTSVSFCLGNTGDVPLSVSVSVPQNLTADSAAQATTLTITCTTEGTLSTTLSAWSNGASFAFPAPLPATTGNQDSCTATAALSNGYSSNGHTIPQFDINFTGNQSS